MTRRELLRNASLGALGLAGVPLLRAFPQESLQSFKGREVFDRIVTKAEVGNWSRLPLGDLMKRIAMELEGTPYVGFTIELSPDKELCVVDFTGLDCVTFFENTLGLARMLKKGGRTPEALMTEITRTRYRGGRLGDYTSRLHYTTDWFVDNAAKRTVKILTPELPGARPFTQKVGFMTKNPHLYRQLKAHPELVPKIRATEEAINNRSLMYLPLDKIAAAEPLLRNGDIVGICTTADGLDISHTGLVIVDDAGVRHFMDASSAKSRMKVTLEPRLSEAVSGSKRNTGIMIARPLEP